MDLPMGPSVCVKFAHVINETCDRPPFSLITYANLKKTEQMHGRWAHRHDKHEQLLGRCAQSIFRMCTPTVQLLTHFCKCADLFCICSILEPSLGPTFYFQGHPGKRRGSWMADRMRQMHNRSAPFNDAMVKKSLVFDYRRSQMCTPPERLQGRIFKMCGPIVHLSGFTWKAASSRQPEFKIVCGCVGVSTKWRPL